MKRMTLFLSVMIVVLSLVSVPALACYGGQAMGMGGAFTSIAEGTQAIYWNQAGLAFGPVAEVSTTFSSPQDKINYNSFNAVAIHLLSVGVGFGQTKLAPWAGGETWNTIGVGYQLTPNLAIGGAYRQVSGEDEYGKYESTGVDFSAQLRAGHLRAGVLVQDANGGSPQNPWMVKNVRPAIGLDYDKVTVAMDGYHVNAEDSADIQNQVGIEYRPWGKEGPLALRAGIYHEQKTYGVGVKLKNGVFVDATAIPSWEVVHVTGGWRF